VTGRTRHDENCHSRQYVNGPCNCDIGYEEEHNSGWTSGIVEGRRVERAAAEATIEDLRRERDGWELAATERARDDAAILEGQQHQLKAMRLERDEARSERDAAQATQVEVDQGRDIPVADWREALDCADLVARLSAMTAERDEARAKLVVAETTIEALRLPVYDDAPPPASGSWEDRIQALEAAERQRACDRPPRSGDGWGQDPATGELVCIGCRRPLGDPF